MNSIDEFIRNMLIESGLQIDPDLFINYISNIINGITLPPIFIPTTQTEIYPTLNLIQNEPNNTNLNDWNTHRRNNNIIIDRSIIPQIYNRRNNEQNQSELFIFDNNSLL